MSSDAFVCLIINALVTRDCLLLFVLFFFFSFQKKMFNSQGHNL